jgi:hypothetical protein
MTNPNDEPRPIKSKKILAVEGQDEGNFFDALLRYIDITDIDIRQVVGKDQFKSKLQTLKRATNRFL